MDANYIDNCCPQTFRMSKCKSMVPAATKCKLAVTFDHDADSRVAYPPSWITL